MCGSHRAQPRLATLLVVSLMGGCVSSDERTIDMPLAAQQYRPLEHFPPASGPGGRYYGTMVVRHLLDERKFGPALEELDHQISTNRESKSAAQVLPQLLVLRGMARFELRDPEGALTDYTEALTIDPDYWPAYFHRWQCHLELGDRAAAQTDRKAGARLAPDEFERDYDPHPGGGMI